MHTPRNMLNIMLYIAQALYQNISEQEVLLIFGDIIISYSLFDILVELLEE